MDMAFEPGDLRIVSPHMPVRIHHIKTAALELQHLRFEWHPESQSVYHADMRVKPPVGQILAYHVKDHGTAHNVVNIFLRGYRLAQKEARRGKADAA